MKKKDIGIGLKEVPDAIELQGGSRVQLMDHINDPSRAGTLSEVIAKLKAKGGSVAKMVNNPMAKKGMAVLGGPVLGAAMTAQDALASEDVGLGSDIVDPMQMQEDYRMSAPEEQLDETQLTPEEVHRWSKIRGMMK